MPKRKSKEPSLSDFKKFLGPKQYCKFQINAAMAIGIIMAEQNLDIHDATLYLINELQSKQDS